MNLSQQEVSLRILSSDVAWMDGKGGVMWPPWPAESKRKQNGWQNEYLNKDN
jgi:hypothetical protein